MFEQLTPHIYCRPYQHYTDRPNIGLIAGSKYALLFDAGNSQANVAQLRQELADSGLPEPDFVALSHWHWDHSFGAHAWDKPVIACEETDEQLRKMTAWTWDDDAMEERIRAGEDIVFCTEMIRREFPDRSRIHVVPADIVFDEQLTVDLGGGVLCHLIRVRGPHSADSVICYVPSDAFVFLGDSNCKDLYGLPWHFDIEHEEDFVPTTDALPYDPEKLTPYLAFLESLSFTHCISGHSDVKTRQEFFSSMK